MDAMYERSNEHLGKTYRQRSKDGMRYQETRLVLKANVELPDEVTNKNTNCDPTTDVVAGNAFLSSTATNLMRRTQPSCVSKTY